MKPKPLHRSITFWSGILVMAFICFAWWDSMKWNAGVRLSLTGLSNRAGMVMAGYGSAVADLPMFELERHKLLPSDSAVMMAFTSPRFVRGGAPSGEPWGGGTYQDQMVYFFKNYQPVGDWHLMIPHWLVLLAVSLIWSSLLLLRSRRNRRASSSFPAEPPPSGGTSQSYAGN